MASPVSHIIYAKKYLEKYPSAMNKDEFILGCIFPDIRRIDSSINRKDTHLCYDCLDLNFSHITAFEAGRKFHVYCDMRREEILKKYNFYSLKNASDFWGLPAKNLEDILLYDEYNNWEKIVSYFNNAPFFETHINVSRETFGLWYAILAKYIEKKPDALSIRAFLSKQPSLVEISKDIVLSVAKLQKNDKVVEILKKIKDEIV